MSSRGEHHIVGGLVFIGILGIVIFFSSDKSNLFAKKNGGDFILRIEDTDQSRYVEGAEQYIIDCLNWCVLTPD